PGCPAAAPAAVGGAAGTPAAVRRVPAPAPGWPTCAGTPCTAHDVPGPQPRRRGGGAPRRRQPAPPPRPQTGPRAPGTAPEKRTKGQGGPQPGDPRRLHGRAAPPAHIQVPVVRVDAGGGGSVLSQLQDVL